LVEGFSASGVFVVLITTVLYEEIYSSLAFDMQLSVEVESYGQGGGLGDRVGLLLVGDNGRSGADEGGLRDDLGGGDLMDC